MGLSNYSLFKILHQGIFFHLEVSFKWEFFILFPSGRHMLPDVGITCRQVAELPLILSSVHEHHKFISSLS